MDFSGVIWRKTDRASSGRPRSRSVSPPRSRPHTGEWGFDNAVAPPYLYAYTAGGEQQISKSVGPRGRTQISPDNLKHSSTSSSTSVSTSPTVSKSTSTSVLTSTSTSTSPCALRNRNKRGSSSSLASVYDGFYLEGTEQESPTKAVAFNSNTVSEDKETHNFYSDDDDDDQHDQNNDQNHQDHKQTTRLQTRPSSNLSENSKTSDAEPYKVVSPEEVMLRGVDLADFQDDEGVVLDGAGQPLPAYTASDNNNNSKGKRNSIWNRLRGSTKGDKSDKIEDDTASDELDDDNNNNSNNNNNNTNNNNISTNNNNNNQNNNNINNNNNNHNNNNNTNNNNNHNNTYNNNDDNDNNNNNYHDNLDNDGATSRQRRVLSTSSDVVVKQYTTPAVNSNEPTSHFYPETKTPPRKPPAISDAGKNHFYPPSPSSKSNEVVVDSHYAYSSPEDARAQTPTRQHATHITYDTPQLDNISSLQHSTPPKAARSTSPTNSLDSSTYGFGKGSNATSENGRNSKEFSPYNLSDGEDENNDFMHQHLQSKPNPQSSSNTSDGGNVERENDYNEKVCALVATIDKIIALNFNVNTATNNYITTTTNSIHHCYY